MKRGQSSFEYIVLVGAILIIVVPLFYYATNKSSESIALNQAEDVVQSLAQAANEVYTLSPGTKEYVWVSMPGNVQAIDISGSEITLQLRVLGNISDIVAVTDAIIVGEISLEKGTYKIPVEHLESGVVQIGVGNDTTEPVIVWTYPSSLACNPIIIRATTDETARCKFADTDMSYDEIPTTMEGTSRSHNYELGVQAKGNYTYYVRCSDAYSNDMSSSEVISYSIDVTLCTDNSTGSGATEYDPPNVTLISPLPSYITNSSRVDFYYNVTDASVIFFCGLYTNNESVGIALNPTKDITNNITIDLTEGDYFWTTNCTDSSVNIGGSTLWNVYVNATFDNDNPITKVSSPMNESIRNFNLIKFFYNVTDATSGISSCALTITSLFDSGGSSTQAITDFSVTENTEQIISLTLEKGNHTWYVSCTDESIYANIGVSETRWLRVNTTTEEAFLTSCAGVCGYNGYSNGICRQEHTKCTQNGETYSSEGDEFCTGGSQSDTCCCVP